MGYRLPGNWDVALDLSIAPAGPVFIRSWNVELDADSFLGGGGFVLPLQAKRLIGSRIDLDFSCLLLLYRQLWELGRHFQLWQSLLHFVDADFHFGPGVAARVHSRQAVAKTSRAVAVSATVIALLTVWNAGFIYQWGTHLVPARGKISWPEMVHNQFVVVPVRMEHSLETYFLHRNDMMQQIEQEDIEQQKAQRSAED